MKTSFVASFVAASAALLALNASAQELVPAPDITQSVSTKTRAEVVAEMLATAPQRHRTLRDADNYRLASPAFKSTKTREQVVAETVEAMRLGLLWRAGEQDAVVPTEAQLLRIAQAGERAAAVVVAVR